MRFDTGGILTPAVGWVRNDTGQPERVLTAEELQDLG